MHPLSLGGQGKSRAVRRAEVISGQPSRLRARTKPAAPGKVRRRYRLPPIHSGGEGLLARCAPGRVSSKEFMELHLPSRPPGTLREFGIHIATVTIGILIALALEGLVTYERNEHLLNETRREFQAELRENQERARIELAGVQDAHRKLHALVDALPELERVQPADIAARLLTVQNPGYFLPANSWQTALSTGAFAHMQPEEAASYSDAFYIIRYYGDVQRDTLAIEDRAKAFFVAHPNLSPDELREGAERIILLERAENSRESVCARMSNEIRRVVPKK